MPAPLSHMSHQAREVTRLASDAVACSLVCDGGVACGSEPDGQ